MKLTQVRVLNYKSHRDTGPVLLGSSFTVLVGQNNAGKTAFLESLRQDTFQNRPHRVPILTPLTAVQNPISTVEFSFSLSGQELLHRILSNVNSLRISVPAPNERNTDAFLKELFYRGEIGFKLKHNAGGDWSSMAPISHQTFARNEGNISAAQLQVSADRQTWSVSALTSGDDLPGFIGAYLNQSVFMFRAERMNVGECPIEASSDLANNAINLASVLLQLPRTPLAHDRYIELVREVFPSIYRVVSMPVNASTARITVIMNDSAGGGSKPGVDVPLNDSGTGISQVLAMLYVAVTSSTRRIIVIDEPNSFLHPGAAKKLLDILNRLDHQYVISTHSSEIIRTANPEFLHLVEWEGSETKFRTLNRGEIQDQRQIISELGVGLSDVFGADNVIWVEGPTEHHCFPVLLAHLGISSSATVIAPLVAPGDLTGRRVRATLVWQLYERLSKGTALIPPALAISLDRECRTLSEISDLERQSGGLVKFLPRRTFENYLLDNNAIAAVLKESCVEPHVTPETTADWLRQAHERPAYGAKGVPEDQWLYVVDAPKVLKDLFWELATTEYSKTTHSLALTNWLLAHKADSLEELLDYVKGLVVGAALQNR